MTRRQALIAVVLVLAGCAGSPPTPTPTDTPLPTLTPSAAATASATASPRLSPTLITLPAATPSASAAIGLPGPGCVNGWQSPAADSELGALGLALLGAYMGLNEPLEAVDVRYFVGPDPDWIIEPRFEAVERWYIKATLPSDAEYRGRWLYEKRDEQRQGVSAVAHFDTRGYQSPDWVGFVGEGEPRSLPGLPGVWSGIDYDFVTGAGDGGQPGLPDVVADCLTGT